MDRYHHGNLKAALLKAALYLAGKTGAERLTLREVARRAGVSHNAPYRHFRSKEDLLAGLATEAFRQLLAATRKSIDGKADPAHRLRAAARGYLDFALENPARFSIMFRSAFDPAAYPEYVAAYDDAVTLLSDLIAAQAFEIDKSTAAEIVWASIHGITELGLGRRLREGSRKHLEQLVDAAIDSLLAGLKHAEAGSSRSLTLQ